MASGLILAGGKSQRMGQDKSLMVLGGRTLIQRVVDALAPLCDDIIVVTNSPDAYAHLNLAMVRDVFPDAGSLGGLYSGLSAVAREPAIAVACDMPFLNTELLRYQVSMSSDADAVVPDLSVASTPTALPRDCGMTCARASSCARSVGCGRGPSRRPRSFLQR